MVFLSRAAVAQAPSPKPAFEVASVKQYVAPPGPRLFPSANDPAKAQISGNRVTFLARLQNLLIFAYDINIHQLSVQNKTDLWRDSFGIAAVSPGAIANVGQVRLMLQALLADRFQLKLHHDTAPVPVYDLSLGKNGSKLKPSSPDSQPSIRSANSAAARNGATRDARLEFTHEPVSEVVRFLSNAVRNEIVLDKTGLTGTYDFTLEYTQDPTAPVGSAQIAAIQTQLGLKVVSAQEPTDILVIDSVQPPSEN